MIAQMSDWHMLTSDMRPADCRVSDWLVLKSLARTQGNLSDAVADTGSSLATVRMVAFRYRRVWCRAELAK